MGSVIDALRSIFVRAAQHPRDTRRDKTTKEPPSVEDLETQAAGLAEANEWTNELESLSGAILQIDPEHRAAWCWRGRCAAEIADRKSMKMSFRKAFKLAGEDGEKRRVLLAYVDAKRALCEAKRRVLVDENRAVIAAFERSPGEWKPSRNSTTYLRERQEEHRRAVARWEARRRPVPEASPSGPCPRCGGSGWIPRFSHVEAGICFRCRGSGV